MKTNEKIARESGIENARAGNAEAVEAALAHGRRFLSRRRAGEEVSVDTLFPSLKLFGFQDGRGVGPVMRTLVKEGWIKKVKNKHRESIRTGSHRRPVQVYRVMP